MKIANDLISILTDSPPESYISPNEIGLDWTYEVGHDKFLICENKRIADYSTFEIDSFDKFLEIIHPQDLDQFFHFTKRAVDFINGLGASVGEHQSHYVFRAKGKGGKLFYLKRHGIINGVSDGKIASNFSNIEDVTWMRPTPGSWKVVGPSTEGFDFEIPEVDRFTDVLSGREIEILRLVARGFRTLDIGKMLNISPYTVSTHRRNILTKLDVANTPELLTLSRDLGLI